MAYQCLAKLCRMAIGEVIDWLDIRIPKDGDFNFIENEKAGIQYD